MLRTVCVDILNRVSTTATKVAILELEVGHNIQVSTFLSIFMGRSPMRNKPTYAELVNRVRELEKDTLELQRIKKP